MPTRNHWARCCAPTPCSRSAGCSSAPGSQPSAQLLRLFPSRSQPRRVTQVGYYRTYPAGNEIDRLGTFLGAPGCPVHPVTVRAR